MEFQNKFILIFALIFLSSIAYVSASECSDAGYKCFDTSCSVGYEEIESFNCPSLVGNRPEVCCKETIDLSKESKILLNKEEFQDGTTFEVNVELPYFSDCTFSFINPKGVEKQEGAGGCGAGVITIKIANIVTRLKQLFGSAESGTYKIKIIASKAGYSDITLTKEFKIVPSVPVQKSDCSLKDGKGECTFLDKTYNIEWGGDAGPRLVVKHDGIEEVFDNGAVNFFSTTLKDGIVLTVTGAPASAYVINLQFSKGEKAPYLKIDSEGTYLVKEGTIIQVNDIEAEVKEISWALSGDTESQVRISANNAQLCNLHEGEECKLFYGPLSAPISKNLIIKVNSIYKNEANPSESTASITVTKIKELFKRIEPKEDTGPIDVTNEDKEELSCNGCLLDNKCYPFGYRKEAKYCSDNYKFTAQLESSQKCENNFECSSNVCVSGECISEGLIKKILNWFKRLFGLS